MFPKTAAEGFYCGLTAKAALSGHIEPMKPPRNSLDILAQHLVSMSATYSYTVDNVLELTRNAFPFRDTTRDDVESVLRMLAGDYEHKRDIPVRPRLLYDRINNCFDGDNYSRLLAVSSGGTIPDTGMYACKTESGVKIGELDEEFVFERHVGTKFMLGAFAWKITSIDRETVRVVPTNPEGAEVPFWRNAWISRNFKTAHIFGEYMSQLNKVAKTKDALKAEMSVLGLDSAAADGAARMLIKQIAATDLLPDNKTIILEHFKDEFGDNLLMVHSIFGRQVNNPLALLLRRATCKLTRGDSATPSDITFFENDDGVLLMPRNAVKMPHNLIQSIEVDTATDILEAILPTTPLFNMTFRYNAGRALMMGVRSGKRQPLWVQRLKSAEMLDFIINSLDHPLIRETRRECLEDYWNIDALLQILRDIKSGEITVHEVFRNTGSPMTRQICFQTEANLLYEYNPTTEGILAVSESAVNLSELTPIKPHEKQLTAVSERRRLPENPQQLHSLLMTEGDMVLGEYDIPLDWLNWLEELAAQNRALWIEPGLWIATEQVEEYSDFTDNLSKLSHIIRRNLRYRGANDACGISARYFIPQDLASQALNTLCEQKSAILDSDSGLYYHADLYQRAVKRTISQNRLTVRTLPPSTYASLRASAPVSAPIESDDEHFWVINDSKVTFHARDDINFECQLNKIDCPIYDTLLARGAMFVPALTKAAGLTEHKQTLEILYNLAEKGLIHADSSTPLKLILERDKTAKSPLKRQIDSRVTALTTGRWEVTRPLKTLSIEEQIDRAFDRVVILCRETAAEVGLPWGQSLELLRVWEYTGQARRGYFVEGLSGAQFIRDCDYERVTRVLNNPSRELVWLNATDPNQVWGSVLRKPESADFMCVPGTVVALMSGEPVAVFERGGKTLRVFDSRCLDLALRSFVTAFKTGGIYPTLNKITVKSYPKEAATPLEAAGFVGIMLDWELYR
jgi:ATP-dependent Lhr-like helicase